MLGNVQDSYKSHAWNLGLDDSLDTREKINQFLTTGGADADAYFALGPRAQTVGRQFRDKVLAQPGLGGGSIPSAASPEQQIKVEFAKRGPLMPLEPTFNGLPGPVGPPARGPIDRSGAYASPAALARPGAGMNFTAGPEPQRNTLATDLGTQVAMDAGMEIAQEVATRKMGVPMGGAAGRRSSAPPPPAPVAAGGSAPPGGPPPGGDGGGRWFDFLDWGGDGAGDRKKWGPGGRATIPEKIQGRFAKAASEAEAAGAVRAASRIRGIGGKLAFGAKAFLPAVAGIGTLMGVGSAAAEGMEQGGGFGAANQAASNLAGQGLGALVGGALGSVVPGPGTAIGAMLGSAIGGGLGDNVGRATTGMALRAVEQGGPLGELLDPLVDTPMEIAARQQAKQAEFAMNDPMAVLMREESKKREAENRATVAKQLYMQMLMS